MFKKFPFTAVKSKLYNYQLPISYANTALLQAHHYATLFKFSGISLLFPGNISRSYSISQSRVLFRSDFNGVQTS